LQIEQFIESIFPSQKPPIDSKSPASIEDAEKKKKEDYEAKWDLIYMIGAVVLTVLILTSFMVGLSLHFIRLVLTSVSSSLPGWLVPASTLLTTR
jgi:hypothetical protein